MTELDIYKFIYNNGLECHWEDEYDLFNRIVKHLYLWVPAYLLKDFCELLGSSSFDDGGICITTLCYDGSTCIENFDEVLESHDIEPERILKKE